jgi:hypothetical protein
MLSLALTVPGTAALAVALIASANSRRFRRRVDREVGQMWAAPSAPAGAGRRSPGTLPAPVRRYAMRAMAGRPTVRTVRLRHGGTFRASLDGRWLPIRGDEYFAADPPGFVWWGRARVFPGLWVEARDRSVGGVGNMLVSAESTLTLADVAGPEMDQGALLRLLAEMPWIPTALLDDRYVGWTPIDDGRAKAMLRVNGHEVAGIFEFAADGLPAGFSADRHRDLGGGRSVLTPWSGEYSDYRESGGLLVPHRVAVSWQIRGRWVPYARFVVDRFETDARRVHRVGRKANILCAPARLWYRRGHRGFESCTR